jgi:aquaporin Z
MLVDRISRTNNSTDPAHRLFRLIAASTLGSALMVMAFAGGHISGAHYDPAVSLAALVAGKLSRRQTASYALTQLAAG